MKLKLTADSTCDLSPELLEKMDVSIVPLYIQKGGVSYRDGVEIHPQEIFRYTDMGGGACSTAAANVADYIELFRRLRRGYDAVIHLNISAEFSSCYQNACLAAKEVGEVYVVDSRNLSTGIGLLVCEAHRMAKEGMAAADIAQELRVLTGKVEASFVIDTLEYLRRGGRCSSITAFSAGLLHIKPCIEVVDGRMKVGKKYRGALLKCIRQYVAERLKGREDLRLDRIFVTHTCSDPALVEAAKEAVRECQDFGEILETKAGCTISCHCGPNTLGVLFLRK